MFCRKCGKPTEGDSTVCSACAAATNQTNQTPVQPPVQPSVQADQQPAEQDSLRTVEPSAEQPIDQDSVQTVELVSEEPVQPISEKPAVETIDVFELNTSGEEPVKPKKKRKKKAGLIAAVSGAAVAVAAVVLVVLNFASVKGFFLKNFAQPEDYMAHVEEQNIGALSDTLASAYGSLLSASEGGSAASRVEFELEIGDEMMSLIEMAMAQSGFEADLSWLNSIMLSLDSNVQDDMAGIDLGLGLSGKQILTLSMIMDMQEQMLWMGLPELNEQFIGMNLGSYVDDLESNIQSMTAGIERMQATVDELKDALPSEETVAKLLDKYIALALGCIDNVEKDSETMRVDGISQKLTVLTITIDEETLYDITVALLEEVRKDSDIEAIVNDISDYVNKINAEQIEGYEEIDLYEEFIDTVDEALETLEDEDVDSDSDNYLEIVDYIGKSDEVVGRAFTVCSDGEETELLRYLVIEDGRDFAFEAEIPAAELEFEGSGNVKNDKINASCELSVANVDLVELEVIDFDQKKLDKGYLSGTLQIRPTSSLLEMAGATGESSSSVMGALIEKIALELEFDCSETSSKVAVNLISDNELLLGLAVSAMEKNAEKVSAPEDAIDVSAMDEEAYEALMEWMGNLDLNGLVDSLKDAGLPSEYADILDALVNSGMGPGTLFDDIESSYPLEEDPDF